MENFLALLAVAALLWGYLEKRIPKPAQVQYECLFEKAIFSSEPEDKQSVGVLFAGGKEAELQRRITLPFPPQLGMVVSDFSEIPALKKEDYTDGTRFSEKIEEINWENVPKIFDCKTAPYFMNNKDSLGDVVLRHLNCGWKLKIKYSRIVVDMQQSIKSMEEEITKIEAKKNEVLKVDRDLLEKMRVLLKENS